MMFSYDDYLEDSAKALCITVSFRGTNKAAIQTDNALGAGIAAQGPHHVAPPWIDWGYTMLLVLDGVTADPYIQIQVWKCYEWGRHGLFPIEQPEADIVYNRTWSYPGVLIIDSDVSLWMVWNATHLNYFASVGGTQYNICSYILEPNQLPYFKLGRCHQEWGPIHLPGTVKFFQFPGAWSVYPIGMGWLSHLSQPCFMKTSETIWRTVDFAYSVHGSEAWLDNTMTWGGANYDGVNAHYFYEPPIYPFRWCEFGHVLFYPTYDGSTLPTDTLLWDPAALSGGGCPFVYTWDGESFVKDNNLLPAAQTSNGTDVADYYRLEQTLVPILRGTTQSLYCLQIREFEHEHDYFDQVKLLSVDHSPDVHVAATLSGDILTYRNPSPPTSAIDENGNSVLASVNASDEQYYQSHNGSYVTMTFANRDPTNGVKLVIRSDEDPIMKSPVYVQAKDSAGEWNTIATFHTRTYWATDIIDMASCLPDGEGELKVRFYFVSSDKIDYVGLDVTPQAEVRVNQAVLLLALHSTQGNVTALLAHDDQSYAELVPRTQMQLFFLMSNINSQERTFILCAEGHYTKID
jgi:hypothetical protein